MGKNVVGLKCVCVCVSPGCPLSAPANVALPINSWKMAAPSPTTTSRRSSRIYLWSMIYDSESALYRRFVQCATPAFDRQRANRIDLQRLMQYLWVLGMPYCVARCV